MALWRYTVCYKLGSQNQEEFFDLRAISFFAFVPTFTRPEGENFFQLSKKNYMG